MAIYIELVLLNDNLLLHIYNLFSAFKTCCCIHLTFSQTCTTCIPNTVLVLTFVLLLLKHMQLVFQHTTCRNRLKLRIIFVKLILKICNLAPNMCVTIKIFTTSLTFSYNFLSIENLADRLITQPIILCVRSLRTWQKWRTMVGREVPGRF